MEAQSIVEQVVQDSEFCFGIRKALNSTKSETRPYQAVSP
jgi:hypothetical protein